MKSIWMIAAVSSLCLLGCKDTSELDEANRFADMAPEVVRPPHLAAPSTINLHQVTGIFPETPAGRSLAWTLERLNLSPEGADEGAITARFDPSVLDGLSAGAVAGQIRELGDARPFAFVGYIDPPTPVRVVAAVMSARRGYQRVVVEVGAGPEHRITTLLFEPYEPQPVAEGDAPPVVMEHVDEEPAADPAAETEGAGSGESAAAGSGDGAAAGSGEAAPE